MKYFYFLTIFCLFHQLTIAQQKISGAIRTENQQPVEFASVSLLKSADSTIYKSGLSDIKGLYQFENIPNGSYILSVLGLGYGKVTRNISVAGQNVNLETIILKISSNTLKEVTVTASKPFLEQQGDKLVVNVEGSAASAGATALEVLQRVPGVMVRDDKLTLIGKGAPAIYIDGRASQYTDVNQVLREMSADNIEKIELITNPGAKYDAAGGAVINIVLKKKANLGTNGTLTLNTGGGFYKTEKLDLDRNFYRFNPSLSLNHRSGKINVFGSYSYFNRNSFSQTNLSRVINPSIFTQNNYDPFTINNHNYRLGLDYYADDKNTFGLILRGFNSQNEGSASNTTFQNRVTDNSLISQFTTGSDNTRSRGNFYSNLNWKHTFDTSGRALNIDLDYSTFDITSQNIILNTLQNGSSYVNDQRINNPVKFGVLKADYTLPLKNKNKLELGIKSSLASIDNYLTFFSRGNIDNDRSTDFIYKENINAAYASYFRSFAKWDFQAGLRAEQTIATGENQNTQVLDRNYIQYFPSLFITRKLNSKLSTIAQYSRRVNRPSYQQQNPFIQFLDSLTYTKGNPSIRPETADQYKLSLTYQNQPFLSFSYNKTSDIIFENAPQQEGNLTFTTVENLASFQNFTGELNFPLNIGKKISGFGGNQFIYNFYNADYLNSTYKRGKWNWMAYWQVNYKPTKTLSLEASGYYMTDFLEEFLIIDRRGSLNLALRKSFMDNKLRLSLSANDIFLTDVTNAAIQFNEINVNFRQFNETRNFRLGLSYSFGNQKIKSARNRTTGSDDETNRVKTN